MPEIALEGARIHVEEMGEGPPLVLIAGLASDGLSWAPVVETLAARHRLILIDNRGAGRTTAPLESLSVARMAGDVIAVLDRLGIARAALLGHSMGGLIGIEVALLAPDRISRLIVAASAPVERPRNLATLRAIAAVRESGAPDELWLPLFFPWLFAPAFFTDEGVVAQAVAMARQHPWPQSAAAFRAQLEAVAAHSLPDPARLALPVTAIAGAEDLLYPPGIVAAALPQAQLRVLDAAGHSLHWDQPQAFVEAVMKALDGWSVPAYLDP